MVSSIKITKIVKNREHILYVTKHQYKPQSNRSTCLCSILFYFRDILVYENRIPIIFNIYVGLWIIQNPPNRASSKGLAILWGEGVFTLNFPRGLLEKFSKK
jgi:hypothetical protein